MMRRTVLAILLAVVLAPVAHGQQPAVFDEDHDGLPGARVEPPRVEAKSIVETDGKDVLLELKPDPR